MQFQSIAGQHAIKEQLVQMVQHNRLSHALLFLGKEGGGALQLAMAFAQSSLFVKRSGRCSKTGRSSLFFGGSGIRETKITQPFTDSCGQCPPVKSGRTHSPGYSFSYPVIPRSRATNRSAPIIYRNGGSSWQRIPTVTCTTGSSSSMPRTNRNITAHECNDIIRKLNLKSFGANTRS